jgi:hypothetical protein
MGSSICGNAHHYYAIESLSGTVEGLTKVKLYAVLACTVCGESQLIEHVMDKADAARITSKGK